MKLVFASSLSHDILKRHIFLGTLCDPWDLVELRFRTPSTGNFGTAGYNRVVLDRIAMALEIVSNSPGELIVFSDVDIQWFRPAQAALMHALEGKDVVFQREDANREIANCGFIGVRCNERSVAYFAALADAAGHELHDQQTTNKMIGQGRMPCRFGFLPPTFYNDNLFGEEGPDYGAMLMYHTIGTFPQESKTSVQLKLEKHLCMRAAVLGTPGILRPAFGVDHVSGGKPTKYKARGARAKGVEETITS